MMHEIKIYILLAAGLLAALSCAPLPQKEQGVQKAEEARKPESEAILAKAGEYVAKGDFKDALDFLKNAVEKNPKDEALEGGYIATIENIKKAADQAFENGDFSMSGKTYYLLLRSVPQSNGFSAGLSFTKKSLTDKINECRSSLSQIALSQYRSGNIENAISIWKNILSFDPGDKSIKKFIDTATTQLKNLKQDH
jgi:tetratricopeptide (TPR) repeat protein